MQPTPTWMEHPAVNNESALCNMQRRGLAVRLPLNRALREISAAKCRRALRHHHSRSISLQVRVVYLGLPGTQPHAVAENEVCGSKFEPKQL